MKGDPKAQTGRLLSYLFGILEDVRADRLVAIVLLLQVHGQLTAGQLAELLETSERTIRRDLEALSAAGVPVYAQRGRGGGWALLGGHRLDLTGFTTEEAQALFLVAGARGAGAQDTPGLRSALRKVFTALPEPLRAHAAAASDSTVVDSARWGRSPVEDPPHLDELRRAVLARMQVDIDYAKPGQAPTRRRVHPYGLVAKSGVWYLLAGTADGRRTFRVSRIDAVVRTEEPFDLPPGFDLAGEWDTVQREFTARMQVTEVTLDVAEGAVLGLTAAFGGWTSVAEQPGASDGWRRVVLGVPHWRAAVGELARFGADVRVHAPAELRQELARIGAGLVAAHGTAPGPTSDQQGGPVASPAGRTRG